MTSLINKSENTFLYKTQGKIRHSKQQSKQPSSKLSNYSYPEGKQKVSYEYKAKPQCFNLSYDRDLNFKKRNGSDYSTMPSSEGDQDAKFSSFKVVLDGKMLLTPKNSDSETRTSPVTCQAREFYAYAKEYQDPSPIKISLPSFI